MTSLADLGIVTTIAENLILFEVCIPLGTVKIQCSTTVLDMVPDKIKDSETLEIFKGEIPTI